MAGGLETFENNNTTEDPINDRCAQSEDNIGDYN